MIFPTGVRVDWTEYERGWGQRPDGTTLHIDMATAEEYIRDYWSRMPEQVPDDYSAPGKPVAIDINWEHYARLKNEQSFWVSPTRHPSAIELSKPSSSPARVPDAAFFGSPDMCYGCIWYMEAASVRHRGERSSELWCGAGCTSLFLTGNPCPMWTNRVILEYRLDSHEWLFASAIDEETAIAFEVREWLRENLPNTRYWISWSITCASFDFVSEQDAVAFRLKWG